jgi:hypothetical protein
MKKAVVLILTFIGISGANAQTPTYNEQVACILYEHCTTCHHDGGIAPFSLMDYDDASAAAFGVMGAVNAGTMPPWPPNPDYNSLAHERLLTQNEIDIITNWVNGGQPQGSGPAPQEPVYTNSEAIANPDLVATMPPYTINTQGNDVYRCFVIPTSLNQDVFITEIEIVPGNPEAVHHVLLYQDQTNVPAQLDIDDFGPGYTSFGGTGSNDSELIGGWVPGQLHRAYPPNFGVRIPAGSNIIMQVHYPASANGQTDQSKVNIKYSTSTVREVFITAPLNHGSLNEGPLSIPANQESTFTCDYSAPSQYDITILDVSPHMHLLGKSIKSWAVTPTNQTIPLIEVEDWDFHWQGFYEFRNPIKIPAGSTLHSTATYDNTTNNPENPNSPPQHVYAGESTTEEMMLVFFSFTQYFPGDENIAIDPVSVHEDHVCQGQEVGIDETIEDQLILFPNPATEQITLQLSTQNVTDIRLTDLLGKTVRQFPLGAERLDVSDVKEGVYLLRVESNGGASSRKIAISH